MNSPLSNKVWIIEHSSGIFLKWQGHFFFKRPLFDWLCKDEEVHLFKSFAEAKENLTRIRRTHPRAYLVELKAAPGLPFPPLSYE